MKYTYQIKGIKIVIADDMVEHEPDQAIIYKIIDDQNYDFDLVSCLARPIEFSAANALYHLDKDELKQACDIANDSQKVQVLAASKYHLLVCPLVERFRYFGKQQAYNLTNEVIDIAQNLGATSLRITQFCLMLSDYLPFYDQFKGILDALTSRVDNTIQELYFDVPEEHSYDLNKLFMSYEKAEREEGGNA